MTDKPRNLIDQIVQHEGDTWTVGGVGHVEDGKVYCHLWSQTRILTTQKNGRKVPIQSCDWVPLTAFNH